MITKSGFHRTTGNRTKVIQSKPHSEISKTNWVKISIFESLTIVIYISVITSPLKIRLFGGGNKKLFKFKEFSLYD